MSERFRPPESILGDMADLPQRLVEYIRESGMPNGYPLSVGAPLDRPPSDAVLRELAENEKRAWIHICSKIIREDEKKLEIAIKALNYYAQEHVYIYPDDWSCCKEGRAPHLEECERCDDIAEAALHDIAAIDAPDEEDK